MYYIFKFFRNYSGILSIISNLLIESVIQDTKNEPVYKCRWDISTPMHPFIFVLQHKNDAINPVIDKMELICSKKSKYDIYNRINTFYNSY